MKGGLNQVSPALTIAPGMAVDCVNFEPSIYGGYKRIGGYERFDGRTAPSDSDYYIAVVVLNAPASVAVGNTITGATSGATAVVLAVNGITELVITRVTGSFVAENITVSAVVKGTIGGIAINAASTPLLHATYRGLAADNYRASITTVPGSGPVRGVKYYNGDVYAFRDNAGATACIMHKATTSGWSAVTFGREIQFVQRTSTVTITIAGPGVVTWTANNLTAGQVVTFSTTGLLPTGISPGVAYYVLAPAANTFTFAATLGGAAITTSGSQSGTHTAALVAEEIVEGNTVTGGTSGATGVARRVLLRTGTWNTAPVGTIVFDTVTGTFTNGERLVVGGTARLNAGTADTAIALTPGGKFEFDNNNFSGTTASYRMYFVDGVNFLCEFDGTRLVPIRTGITPDAPKHLAVWKNMMVVSVESSVQVSSIGDPYQWSAITGAAELAIGDTCTGLLPQLGDSSSGAIAIFTESKTYVLYGNSSADFNLQLQSPDAGAQPYTAQNIGFAYYLDAKGVVQINATRSFGNFESATITRLVQPYIDSKRGLATASCIVRNANQYRLFFSDGTGLIIYITQTPSDYGSQTGTAASIMPFNYSTEMYVNTVDSVVDEDGLERIFAAGSNGYVYELSKGTSFDGNNIFAFLLMSFNSNRSPRSRKHYKRTILQADCEGIAQLNVGYDLSYADTEADSGFRSLQTLLGEGGYWDSFVWDSFSWDTGVVQEYIIDTPGNGRNIGLIIYGDSDIDDSYIISSAILNYTVNRLER